MSVCKGMIRCLLIIFNLLFWFCGTAILALGIYVLADKNIKKKLQVFKFDTNDSYFKTLAYLLIGVGAFIFVVSFCGCCGAIRKNRLLLGVYITLLSLLMIVELAAGILTIFRKKQIKTGLSEKLLNNLQKQFGKSSVITLAWNAIQVSEKCCGVYGPSDYNSSFWINSSHNEFPDKNKDKDKDKEKDISGALSNFSKVRV